MSFVFDEMCHQVNIKLNGGLEDGCSTQYCRLSIHGNRKRKVDNEKAFGLLLLDLSRVLDFLSHRLLVAKLCANGFSFPAIRPVNNYL